MSDEDYPWCVSVEHDGRLYTGRLRWADWGFKVGWRVVILDIQGDDDGAAWVKTLSGRVRVALPEPGTCLITYRFGSHDSRLGTFVVTDGSANGFSREFEDWQGNWNGRIWRVEAGHVGFRTDQWSIIGVMPEVSCLGVSWKYDKEAAGLGLSVAPGSVGSVRVSRDGGSEAEVAPVEVEQLLEGTRFRISLDDVNGQVGSLDVRIWGGGWLHVRISGELRASG
ncbi:MAG: hypothetical protein HY812_19080 [Planctomycetes bacterium]|nr:hypothetical protein [Planctomycetota bacterium]